MTQTQTSEMTIRSASPADSWAVRLLFGRLHAFNADLDPRFALAEGWEDVLDEHLAHLHAAGHGLTLLAWRDAAPVGLLMMDGHTDSPLFRHRHWAELLALYVEPELRGHDLARRLMSTGARWAHRRGYERIQLYVTASNLPARRFYKRMGFAPAQEIWRAELGASPVPPPEDADCKAIYASGHDLLAPHAHALGIDGVSCEPQNPESL